MAMAPFLGSPAAFPVGPYVLASVLQCPIYLMFPLRGRQGYEVYFRAAVRIRPAAAQGPRRGAGAAGLAAYAARLQHYASLSPLEWFNFYDFWHTQSGHEDATS
ncbi:hypothetical protein LP419_36600 [Massilia sp. H-1]|nr:hypothetical protein LP419_36600 [Massilia sp. H-1]